MTRFASYLIVMLVLLRAAALADTPVESSQLQTCLKRADDLPDIAAVEAGAWLKEGGSNDARLCRAFAQSNRGMHADAARDFWALASVYDKTNTARAVTMHNMSGQEFLSAKDVKNASVQYAATLKLAPQNVEGLVGRAECSMQVERYWDAIDDLNRALKNDPNSLPALRQRGRAWEQLGNEKNAQEDFAQAEALEAPEAAQ